MSKKPSEDGNENQAHGREQSERQDPLETDEVESLVENAPPQVTRTLERVLAFGKREERGLPEKFYDAVGKQLNDKHLSAVIENADKADKRLFIHSIVHNLIRGVSVLGFIAILILLTIWLARDDRELYLQIVQLLIAGGGGFGAGYGYRALRDK